MAITMQGSWTVTVKSKNAAFAQRFVISGAASGNGNYAGNAGTSVFVTGAQWSINVQSQKPGDPWRDSRQRITFPTISGGGSLLHFDIRTDDVGGGNDLDFNDLILTCSMPTSASEFVVYGNAKTYQGRCLWNPCYPWYYVIDSAAVLERALNVPAIRAIIERLYPERIPRPGPNPPPGPLFTPLVLPTGTPVTNTGIVFRSGSTQTIQPEAEIKNEKDVRKFQEAAVAKLRGSAQPVSFDGAPVTSGASLLKSNELLSLAKLNDRVAYFNCDVEPAAGLLLNFEEYDRTGAEKLGGAYTGTGSREILGLAATDELGNYVFHFSRSLSDIADETLDVGPGELLATQIFPDVIVQAIGTGMQVDYESAPYYNIPNLYRIDLCLPYGTVHPSTGACDAFDRTIVKIGDIIVLHAALGGTPNTLDGTGRITCRNANAPRVDCAAWRGGLRVYACLPTGVTWYSMRYKRFGIDPTFQPVGEQFKLNHIPDFAVGYTGTIVGSTLVSVHVDGGPAIMHPVYENHQGDSNWIENDLKLILSSGLYTGPSMFGSVDFKIEGYDAGGNLVAGTQDTIRLYLDNKLSTGSIKNVTVAGVVAPDDCALITLPSPSAPITVQYTIDNPEGFLASWALSVTRGNNVNVPVTASGVVPASFPAPSPPGPADPCAFHGSQDYTLDVDGFTDTVLVPSPSGTNWLPAGKTFCAFAFTLSANDRVTDGRNGYPQSVYWQDLVGLNI